MKGSLQHTLNMLLQTLACRSNVQLRFVNFRPAGPCLLLASLQFKQSSDEAEEAWLCTLLPHGPLAAPNVAPHQSRGSPELMEVVSGIRAVDTYRSESICASSCPDKSPSA